MDATAAAAMAQRRTPRTTFTLLPIGLCLGALTRSAASRETVTSLSVPSLRCQHRRTGRSWVTLTPRRGRVLVVARPTCARARVPLQGSLLPSALEASLSRFSVARARCKIDKSCQGSSCGRPMPLTTTRGRDRGRFMAVAAERLNSAVSRH